MKIALVLLVITICVLGFLAFLWYASKQDSKKPIDEVKESDRSEVEFIKKIQAQYQGHKEDIKKEETLKPENRGALFMRAIERKHRGYKDDDEEYEHRLEEMKRSKENTIAEQEQVSKGSGIDLSKKDDMSLPPSESFHQENKEESEPLQDEQKEQKEQKEQEEEDTINKEISFQQEQGLPEQISTSPIETVTTQVEGRINRNDSVEAHNFEKRKAQVEMKEKDQKIAIQRLREEILLEAENLKKRRLALISGAITN